MKEWEKRAAGKGREGETGNEKKNKEKSGSVIGIAEEPTGKMTQKPERKLCEKSGCAVTEVMCFFFVLQDQRAYSFCGTIEYMAPEVVRGGTTGHDIVSSHRKLGQIRFAVKRIVQTVVSPV